MTWQKNRKMASYLDPELAIRTWVPSLEKLQVASRHLVGLVMQVESTEGLPMLSEVEIMKLLEPEEMVYQAETLKDFLDEAKVVDWTAIEGLVMEMTEDKVAALGLIMVKVAETVALEEEEVDFRAR
jgi:hypothetical protein